MVFSAEANERFANDFLSKFKYDDWEETEFNLLEANDEEYEKHSSLQVGDFLIIIFEEPSTATQTFHWARIIIDEDYGIPCFAVNEDLDDLNNSGELWGIHETALNAAFFSKVSEKSWFEDSRNF